MNGVRVSGTEHRRRVVTLLSACNPRQEAQAVLAGTPASQPTGDHGRKRSDRRTLGISAAVALVVATGLAGWTLAYTEGVVFGGDDGTRGEDDRVGLLGDGNYRDPKGNICTEETAHMGAHWVKTGLAPNKVWCPASVPWLVLSLHHHHHHHLLLLRRHHHRHARELTLAQVADLDAKLLCRRQEVQHRQADPRSGRRLLRGVRRPRRRLPGRALGRRDRARVGGVLDRRTMG